MSKSKLKTERISAVIFAVAILLGLGLITSAFLFLDGMPLYIKMLVQGLLIAMFAGSLCFYLINKPVLFRLNFTLTIMSSFLMLGYILLYLNGVFDKLYNLELIKNFILSTGIYGQVVYVCLQIIQVVILPIPSIILNLAGVALFGPWQSFFLISLGVMIGSIIAFAIGRVFGAKLVTWIVGKEDVDKYRGILNKGKYLLIIMFIFPLFPDDILCMAAGLTTMSWGYFLTVTALTRPITVALTCFFGSGDIIPFHGWGVVVWMAIFLLMAILFYFMNKYKANLHSLIRRLTKKKRKKHRADS